MISILWIVVAGVVIFAGLYLLKFEHHARKIKMILLIVLGLLLVLSLVQVFQSPEHDLQSPKGIVQAVYSYAGWVGSTSANLWAIGKDTVRTVGNAIKLNNSDEDKTFDGRR